MFVVFFVSNSLAYITAPEDGKKFTAPQVICFSFVSTSLAYIILPYPKTKEKQNLPEISLTTTYISCQFISML